MSLKSGNEIDAEPPYTPLGFSPYEIGPDGKSEFSKTMEAIDQAFDRRQDLPQHVKEMGKVALYAELSKQALRNKLPDGYEIDEPAKKARYAPDQLLELMVRHDILRAVELGRFTDLGQTNADQNIHEPLRQSLLGNSSLDTVVVDEEPRFKSEPVFVSEELVAVEVKQRRMQHFGGSIVTPSRTLFLIDMLHPDNPAQNKGNVLKPIKQPILDYVNGRGERPKWSTDALTTYYAAHLVRLSVLSEDHYHISPNLPAWTRPTIDK